MTAFFHIQLPRVAHASGAAAFRVAAASGELGLFVGMLLAVAVLLMVMAGLFV